MARMEYDFEIASFFPRGNAGARIITGQYVGVMRREGDIIATFSFQMPAYPIFYIHTPE